MASLAAAKLIRFALILGVLALLPRHAAALEVVGKSAVSMDANSGKILWRKNENLQLPPASTAKIVTALVVVERNRLDTVVNVPPVVTKVGGAKIPLEEGEPLSVEALLYAMMLGSGNDAAVTLAHHSGGSVKQFVGLMNAKAKALGAKRSRFVNPTGLPEKGQASTALDLALITKAALMNADFRRIVATKSVPWKSARHQGELLNRNRLLDEYSGAIGVKTGSTAEAGFCLVAAATRKDRTVIAVVLNSGEHSVWQDAKSLLGHGFAASAR